MAIEKVENIWHNGKLIPWDDATIHVMSHVVHYGSSVFEGIRCYNPKSRPAIFRANEHIQRLLDSAKVYRIDVPFSRDEIVKGMLETVGSNGAWPCYVRPIVLRGYGEAGVNPFNGYTEGIALDINGFVSEGSGENVFLVHRDKLITAPLGNSVLPGITRDSVLQIARDLNIPIAEHMIPREMLYIADEAFFTGTAAEITPIRSVDKIKVGNGRMGPITKAIQKEFYAIVRGEKEDRYGWLTPVPVSSKQPVGV